MGKIVLDRDEGYGVYERTDRHTPMRDVMLAGIYEPVGAVPELGTLLAPLNATVELNGIVVVATEYRQAAIAALESMKFVLSSAATADPIEGNATYVLGGFGGSGWVTSMISAGLVVMVQSQSVQTGSVRLAATKNPYIVAQLCKPGAGWAVLGGSDAIVAQAAGTLKPITIGPPGGCKPPYVLQGDMCVLPQTAPVPAPAEENKLPAWVLPVAIGGGALLIAGLLLVGKKGSPRPKAMTPNAARAAASRSTRYEIHGLDTGYGPYTLKQFLAVLRLKGITPRGHTGSGDPTFKELMGPTYDEPGVVRYETWGVYDLLSR